MSGKIWIGITDKGWYDYVAARKPEEVNFWKPGVRQAFGAIDAGDLFLFKLHSPNNYIAGGASLADRISEQVIRSSLSGHVPPPTTRRVTSYTHGRQLAQELQTPQMPRAARQTAC